MDSRIIKNEFCNILKEIFIHRDDVEGAYLFGSVLREQDINKINDIDIAIYEPNKIVDFGTFESELSKDINSKTKINKKLHFIYIDVLYYSCQNSAETDAFILRNIFRGTSLKCESPSLLKIKNEVNKILQSYKIRINARFAECKQLLAQKVNLNGLFTKMSLIGDYIVRDQSQPERLRPLIMNQPVDLLEISSAFVALRSMRIINSEELEYILRIRDHLLEGQTSLLRFNPFNIVNVVLEHMIRFVIK